MTKRFSGRSQNPPDSPRGIVNEVAGMVYASRSAQVKLNHDPANGEYELTIRGQLDQSALEGEGIGISAQGQSIGAQGGAPRFTTRQGPSAFTWEE